MSHELIQYRRVLDGEELEVFALDKDKNIVGTLIIVNKSKLQNILQYDKKSVSRFYLNNWYSDESEEDHNGNEYAKLAYKHFHNNSLTTENINKIFCFEVNTKEYLEKTELLRTEVQKQRDKVRNIEKKERKYRLKDIPRQIEEYNKGLSRTDKGYENYGEYIHEILNELEHFIRFGYEKEDYIVGRFKDMKKCIDRDKIQEGLKEYQVLKLRLIGYGFWEE